LQTWPNLACTLAKYQSLGLNPMSGGVYAFETNGKLTFTTQYTVMLGIVERTGELWFSRSVAVYQGEEFSIDLMDGTVSHKADISKRNGQPIGAYAIVVRAKTAEEAAMPKARTVVWAPWKTYAKSNSDKSAWGTSPEIMIEKAAMRTALRRSFPMVLSGLYEQEEFESPDIAIQEIKAIEPIATPFPGELTDIEQPETEATTEQAEVKDDLFGNKTHPAE
jgi:recombinational DNA repair protein RecT